MIVLLMKETDPEFINAPIHPRSNEGRDSLSASGETATGCDTAGFGESLPVVVDTVFDMTRLDTRSGDLATVGILSPDSPPDTQ